MIKNITMIFFGVFLSCSFFDLCLPSYQMRDIELQAFLGSDRFDDEGMVVDIYQKLLKRQITKRYLARMGEFEDKRKPTSNVRVQNLVNQQGKATQEVKKTSVRDVAPGKFFLEGVPFLEDDGIDPYSEDGGLSAYSSSSTSSLQKESSHVYAGELNNFLRLNPTSITTEKQFVDVLQAYRQITSKLSPYLKKEDDKPYAAVQKKYQEIKKAYEAAKEASRVAPSFKSVLEQEISYFLNTIPDSETTFQKFCAQYSKIALQLKPNSSLRDSRLFNDIKRHYDQMKKNFEMQKTRLRLAEIELAKASSRTSTSSQSDGLSSSDRSSNRSTSQQSDLLVPRINSLLMYNR